MPTIQPIGFDAMLVLRYRVRYSLFSPTFTRVPLMCETSLQRVVSGASSRSRAGATVLGPAAVVAPPWMMIVGAVGATTTSCSAWVTAAPSAHTGADDRATVATARQRRRVMVEVM